MKGLVQNETIKLLFENAAAISLPLEVHDVLTI